MIESYQLGRHPEQQGPCQGLGSRATWRQIDYWNKVFMEQGRECGTDGVLIWE